MSPRFVVQRFVPPTAAEFAAGVRGQWDAIGDPTEKASATTECLRLRRAERGEASYRVTVAAAQPRTQPEPAPGDAKDMPPGLAEELAAMAPADRAVAERIADLPEIEPPPGYEDRAVDRARREGVLPPTS